MNRTLDAGERIIDVEPMSGGITAEMRKLTIWTTAGFSRNLVLRTYTEPASLQHAQDSLERESAALTMLSGSVVQAPELLAVDATAAHCEYPSLLMTHLPGSTVLSEAGVAERVPLLARQLVAIHAVNADPRPREYQTMTTADTVVVPARADAEVWAAAIRVLRGPVPTYDGRVLHRDFQPGNVLFDASQDATPRITGVVDWAGASRGPTDLDVAHCSTNLALLHGPQWGARFASAYEESGGVLSENTRARQYWRVRDALACSEEVQLWSAPWRKAGRVDLTPRLVEDRLDAYISMLMDARGH
ncbi:MULTISPECIES: phosphotransferase family protein [unclassified Rhodococcus (in: high G+C Gram-positive bacteria)]|uniref:phosphotransferase family protein n=1 Tax=unclassified Rhodococcus (in: high G+C Gram-positive bacteria) TaxID=192944 RepID=UPI001C52B336|nr:MULTISPECIES: aminoglycoside phosphotransferase family protein [unclassified Rhodococcus (in: high G+C Gram-positive bacteria)]